MKLLEKNELGNGLTITINDASRQIAGDRFNVKVHCLINLKVKDEWFTGLPDSPKMIERVKSRLGDQVDFQIIKERSFVDQIAKDDLVAELVAQLKATIFSYVSSVTFPEKLFACRFDELRKKVSVPEADILPDFNDDEGPVDFSSCFIDT